MLDPLHVLAQSGPSASPQVQKFGGEGGVTPVTTTALGAIHCHHSLTAKFPDPQGAPQPNDMAPQDRSGLQARDGALLGPTIY